MDFVSLNINFISSLPLNLLYNNSKKNKEYAVNNIRIICPLAHNLNITISNLITRKISPFQKGRRDFLVAGGWDPHHTVLPNSLRRICLRLPRGSDSLPDCHSLPLGRSLRSLPPSYSPFGSITRSRMSVSTPITKKNSVAQMGN